MATPYAYFKREIVPLSDAKIGVMTHAFNYGTAVFEGVRGNWNEDESQIYAFRMKEHYDRLRRSCRIMRIDFPYENEELSSITTQLVEMSGYREDVYIRPLLHLIVAARGGHRHTGAGEDHGDLRQLGPGQDRGQPQRLRRGDHARR